MKNNHILWSLLVALAVTSCGKNEDQLQPTPDKRSPHDQLIDQQFTGNWKLVRIRTSEPIDADLDGNASTDLMAEIPDHANVIAQLKVNWFVQRRVFADGYIRTYPIQETGWGSPEYVVNGRVLYFDVNESRTQLSLTNETETKSYPLQFTAPNEFTIDGIERTYYTKAGWKTIPTTSTYQRM